MQMQPGRALSSRWLRHVFSLERCHAPTRLPIFLCPALRPAPFGHPNPQILRHAPLVQTRKLHAQASARSETDKVDEPRTLPLQCSGCGALSQTTVPGQPGYLNLQRKAVREYLGIERDKEDRRTRREDDVVEQALRDIDMEELEGQGVNLKTLMLEREPIATPSNHAPICDRCHDLVHHSTGTSIFHPSMESLRDTIFESPYKYNYVYHVLDAADFPMSLVPKIAQILDTAPLRSHNRRNRGAKYYANKNTELDFIITRSDLLGPKKDHVDRLMPYLRETLRDALGRTGKDVRLGNLKCVSARRGWWTKQLKEEIFERGGAGWMVGKANVGKSNLFSVVFPKGKADIESPKHSITVDLDLAKALERHGLKEPEDEPGLSFLPPAPSETQYPAMPLVSSLPGTTASPIRLSFGGGKGELIDLPGLPRSDLESYVQEEHRSSLVMRKRIVPEQQVLKPGKSLLLGGFIRITPRTPNLDILTYNFTPLKEHITSTEKAIGIQERSNPVNIENISTPEASEKMKLAGSFQLRHDVTKLRAGPLTRKSSVNLSVEQLPFRVLSVDILIEGCGWVEIVAQVRANDLFTSTARRSKEEDNPEFPQSLDLSQPEPEPESSDANWPVIDVFTPEGRFVGSRRPMNAWLMNKPRQEKTGKRPRRSMRSAKKTEKQARRGE